MRTVISRHYKSIFSITVLIISMIVLGTCIGQKNAISFPVPGPAEMIVESFKEIDIDSIIESKDGHGTIYLPDWLSAFISGGIAKAEELSLYHNKYLFIGINTGNNFAALSKWAENFTVVHNFPRLAAARIEKRLISEGSLYPDDEYGLFFETLIKRAFNAEYPGAVKEETYWIKILANNETGNAEENIAAGSQELYDFFILISIDKSALRNIINGMMSGTVEAVDKTRAQNASIRRIQQIFFEGF